MEKKIIYIIAGIVLFGCQSAYDITSFQYLISQDLIKQSYFRKSDCSIILKSTNNKDGLIFESEKDYPLLKITVCKGGFLLSDEKYEGYRTSLNELKKMLKDQSLKIGKDHPLAKLSQEERIKLLDVAFSESANMPKIGKRAIIHTGFVPNSNQNIIFTTSDGCFDIEIEAPLNSEKDDWGIVDVNLLAELISTKYNQH